MAKQVYRAYLKVNDLKGWWYRGITNPKEFCQNRIIVSHKPVAIFFYDANKNNRGCLAWWNKERGFNYK